MLARIFAALMALVAANVSRAETLDDHIYLPWAGDSDWKLELFYLDCAEGAATELLREMRKAAGLPPLHVAKKLPGASHAQQLRYNQVIAWTRDEGRYGLRYALTTAVAAPTAAGLVAGPNWLPGAALGSVVAVAGVLGFRELFIAPILGKQARQLSFGEFRKPFDAMSPLSKPFHALALDRRIWGNRLILAALADTPERFRSEAGRLATQLEELESRLRGRPAVRGPLLDAIKKAQKLKNSAIRPKKLAQAVTELAQLQDDFVKHYGDEIREQIPDFDERSLQPYGLQSRIENISAKTLERIEEARSTFGKQIDLAREDEESRKIRQDLRREEKKVMANTDAFIREQREKLKALSKPDVQKLRDAVRYVGDEALKIAASVTRAILQDPLLGQMVLDSAESRNALTFSVTQLRVLKPAVPTVSERNILELTGTFGGKDFRAEFSSPFKELKDLPKDSDFVDALSSALSQAARGPCPDLLENAEAGSANATALNTGIN